MLIYNKAKIVLAHHKEGPAYGALLSDMGICYEKLQQWNEAVTC